MPIPAQPPLEEVWDEEARENAWRNIQEMLREGDQESAALLMAQLNAHGGQPGTSQAVQVVTGEPEPYNPTEVRALLAFYFHWSPRDIRELDYREMRGYVRELGRILERQNKAYETSATLPETPEEIEQEVVALHRQGWQPARPTPYSGKVVPVK